MARPPPYEHHVPAKPMGTGRAFNIVHFVVEVVDFVIALLAVLAVAYCIWWLLKATIVAVFCGRGRGGGGGGGGVELQEVNLSKGEEEKEEDIALMQFPPPGGGSGPEGEKLCCSVCALEFEDGDVIERIPCGGLLHHRCGGGDASGEITLIECGWCEACRSSRAQN